MSRLNPFHEVVIPYDTLTIRNEANPCCVFPRKCDLHTPYHRTRNIFVICNESDSLGTFFSCDLFLLCVHLNQEYMSRFGQYTLLIRGIQWEPKAWLRFAPLFFIIQYFSPNDWLCLLPALCWFLA